MIYSSLNDSLQNIQDATASFCSDCKKTCMSRSLRAFISKKLESFHSRESIDSKSTR